MAMNGEGWAIYFDAVGTILHADPSPVDTYHQVGMRFGSRLARQEVGRYFREAWQRQELLDRSRHWQTNEIWEEERWRNLVAGSVPDNNNPEKCFQELFEHFARPVAWKADSMFLSQLDLLTRAGFQLGIASNFDSRLRGILAEIPQLDPLKYLAISSEIGWRKPAPRFFQFLMEQVNLPSSRIIFIGDDPLNDYEGAQNAGFVSILFKPGQSSRLPFQLTSWNDLPQLLEEITQPHQFAKEAMI